MPKRKVRSNVNRSQEFVKILMNLSALHSPCTSPDCSVQHQHCAGCSESYPCKSAQILAGRTVAQVNRRIDEMLASADESVVIHGDQSDEEVASDESGS